MKIIKNFLVGLIGLAAVACSEGDASVAPSKGGNSSFKGGSMARFALSGDYLYTVNSTSVKVFDVKQTTNPIFKNQIAIGRDIETIFPYQNRLYIGSQTGMIAMDLVIPESPKLLYNYAHVQACDPVVVEGSFAYVTIRSETTCRGTEDVNQLEILNISGTYPTSVATYQMTNPKGLGVDNGLLFLCDGKAGLKVYDTDNVANIKLLASFPKINAYDVIPNNGTLILSATDAIWQYQYDVNTKTIKELGKIEVIAQ